LLVRQKADDFEQSLRPYFEKYDVRLVNHAKQAATIPLQDLLKDRICSFGVELLRLSVAEAPPRSWDSVRETLLLLRQLDPVEDDIAYLDLEDEIHKEVDQLRLLIASLPVESSSADQVAARMEEFVPDRVWSRGFRSYQDSDAAQRARSAFAERLRQVLDYTDKWWSVAADFGGENAVSILSIHRSKGLEFDTVINVGFDDASWWSYRRDPSEGNSTFFVGMSRARRRLIYAHCAERGRRHEISPLFDLLQQAGVAEEHFT
ncbi:3'-5' exonuclease, partial [Pseudonocardia saturnea]